MTRPGIIEGSSVKAVMDLKDITSIGQSVTALETRIGQCLIEIAAVKAENKLLLDRVVALEAIVHPPKQSVKVKEVTPPVTTPPATPDAKP